MRKRPRKLSPTYYWGTSHVPEEPDATRELQERLVFAERCLETLRADNRAEEERLSVLLRQLDVRGAELDMARRERDAARRERDEAEAAFAAVKAALRRSEESGAGLKAELEELRLKHADLVRENSSLRRRLKAREGSESPFGDAGGPSTSRPFKKNSTPESQGRKGGAGKGHAGHGRRSFAEGGEAKHEECLDVPPRAHCCEDMRLTQVGERRREYDRYVPARTEHVVARIGVFKCAACGKVIYARPGDVLKRMSYSNSFLAAGAVKFYVQGHTAGDVERELGVGEGAFFSMMDTVADRLLPAFEEIRLETARQSSVNVDETTWWTDGVKGYSWIFSNGNVALHLFPGTRSSSVPAEFFGYAAGKGMPGTSAAPSPTDGGEDGMGEPSAKRTPLEECRAHEGKTVVTSDRYSGYSPLDVRHQYCFEHLKRDLKRLLDDSPGNDEVRRFHDALRPLLAESMGLCADKAMPDREYYRKAQELKEKIRKIVFAEARDHGVQEYQNIWREKWTSLFAWVEDRRIRCDNNAAERAIRPTVIARKISMGSQGARGVRNREIITSVLMTVKIRGDDPYQWLVNLLDALARNPETDVAGALPEPDVTLRKKRLPHDTPSLPA